MIFKRNSGRIKEEAKMKSISKKRKLYLIGLSILAVFVVSGVFLCKSTSTASPNGLTPERIYEIHREYIESTYGPGTGFKIDSYGEAGTGYVNHRTGETAWNIRDDGR